MIFNVVYSPEVYNDLQEAIDFYNSPKPDLGFKFIKTVKLQISKIKSNAYGFQVRYSDIRCAPLNKFPYTVHYRVLPKTMIIMITAILCDYRNPQIADHRSTL
jgi:hypothetical protein